MKALQWLTKPSLSKVDAWIAFVGGIVAVRDGLAFCVVWLLAACFASWVLEAAAGNEGPR